MEGRSVWEGRKLKGGREEARRKMEERQESGGREDKFWERKREGGVRHIKNKGGG